MKDDICWIHLSDIHAGVSDFWTWEAVTHELTEDISRLTKAERLRPSLLLVTGDLAYHGLKKEFDKAGEVIAAVAHAAHIGPENIFIVPGNHDVNWQALRARVQELVAAGNKSRIETFLNRDESTVWEDLAHSSEYNLFLQRSRYTHLLRKNGSIYHHHVREVNGFPVAVVGIDSAWLSLTSPEQGVEKGKLLLAGEFQAVKARNWLFRQKIDLSYDPTIVMMHHPPEWAHPDEGSVWREHIAPHYKFFLHGHEHEAWHSIQAGCQRIEAGACYNPRYGQSNSTAGKGSGYNVVAIDILKRQMHVWFREYQGGLWGRMQKSGVSPDGEFSVDLPWLSKHSLVLQFENLLTDRLSSAKEFLSGMSVEFSRDAYKEKVAQAFRILLIKNRDLLALKDNALRDLPELFRIQLANATQRLAATSGSAKSGSKNVLMDLVETALTEAIKQL